MLKCELGKNSLNNFILSLVMVSETFPCSYTSPHNHSWIFETLRVIIFWVRVTHKMFECELGKNTLNNFISHLSWLEKLSPAHTHSLKTFRQFLKTLWVIIFWVRVTHKILNVNWEKNSLNNFISHLSWFSETFPNSYTSPYIHSWIFKNPASYYFFELESLIKSWMWIWEKIHSMILSLTCHGFRNFPLLIHIHSQPFVNFWNPMSYYFLS